MPSPSTSALCRALRTRTPFRAAPTRAFTLSTRQFAQNDIPKKDSSELSTNSKTNTSNYPDDKHTVNKTKSGDVNDPQSAGAAGGIHSAKETGTGGHATEGKDSAGGAAKAKKEFPEAPDPGLGMQDERGGRGG